MLNKVICPVVRAFGQCEPVSLDQWVASVSAEIPDVPRYALPFSVIRQELADLGITCMTDMPDYQKRFTSYETLKLMLPHLTYRADYYIANLEINCDDYALWAAADARRLFNIQGVWQCWGDMPQGYHAWNIARTEQGYFMFEPNAGFPWAGELYRIGDFGYIPKRWK